jgi:inner membrane protein
LASVFTHVAVPLLIGRVVKLPAGTSPRRLALTAAAAACVADLDIAAPLFDVQPDSMLAHRGLLHGWPFAAVIALVLSAAFFRGPAFKRVLLLLFAAAASHGLLDLLTRGDAGVALFAPFSTARLLLPLRPMPVIPVGVGEYFGIFGAIVLLNELLLVVVPVALVTELIRRARGGLSFSPLTAATAAWILVACVVWLRWPALYAPTGPRVIKGYGAAGSDEDLQWIPRDPLPEGRLVTRFDELAPLFGRPLTPAVSPWSSGFFPAWYGGAAGRWQDGRLTLIARTLLGTTPPAADEARARLERDNALCLSPAEKYDLAHGDYAFTATRSVLKSTHNASPLPRFWFGLCNGVAAAALERPEPFRAVDVRSPDGHVVRFLPLDVKALLAKAYYWTSNTGVLGGACEVTSFDAARDCSMNPAGLTLATLNMLGRARRSFLIDVFPTVRSQNYAVASAQVDIVRPPYAPAGEPLEAALKDRVAQLVDVELRFALSSTTLGLDAGRDGKVGTREVPFRWQATLALDKDTELIGGRWRGDPADGPDNATFIAGGPLLDAQGRLETEPLLDWPFIDALARASTGDGPGVPALTVP